MTRRAVVLLSGGLDSATVAMIARGDGFDIHALSFDYGQRNASELDAAARVAAAVGVSEHKVVRVELRAFGGSALTDDVELPTGRTVESMAGEIPVTYVPARNTIFLSYGLAYAEVLGAADVFIGVNAVDYSGYPDCRPEFIAAFQTMARLATRAGVEGDEVTIHAPLMHLSKAQIVARGTELGVDYALTVTCYDADTAGRACGVCDSCVLRRNGFEAAGVPDPTRYR